MNQYIYYYLVYEYIVHFSIKGTILSFIATSKLTRHLKPDLWQSNTSVRFGFEVVKVSYIQKAKAMKVSRDAAPDQLHWVSCPQKHPINTKSLNNHPLQIATMKLSTPSRDQTRCIDRSQEWYQPYHFLQLQQWESQHFH